MKSEIEVFAAYSIGFTIGHIILVLVINAIIKQDPFLTLGELLLIISEGILLISSIILLTILRKKKCCTKTCCIIGSVQWIAAGYLFIVALILKVIECINPEAFGSKSNMDDLKGLQIFTAVCYLLIVLAHSYNMLVAGFFVYHTCKTSKKDFEKTIKDEESFIMTEPSGSNNPTIIFIATRKPSTASQKSGKSNDSKTSRGKMDKKDTGSSNKSKSSTKTRAQSVSSQKSTNKTASTPKASASHSHNKPKK